MNRYLVIAAGASGVLLIITILMVVLTGGPRGQTANATPTPIAQPVTQASEYPIPDPAATPPSGKSMIAGQLCSNAVSLDEFVIPEMMVVAEQMPSREKTLLYYPGYDIAGTAEYQLVIEPGTYQFYTQTLDNQKLALFSSYANCPADQVCSDHNLISLSIGPNQKVTEIDICDYDWIKLAPTRTIL